MNRPVRTRTDPDEVRTRILEVAEAHFRRIGNPGRSGPCGQHRVHAVLPPDSDRLTSGGESGIRTRDTVPRIHTFQACAFNHSAISPHASACGQSLIPKAANFSDEIMR